MNHRTLLPAGLAIAGLLACSHPATVPPNTTTQGGPTWIDHEEIPDGLAAVGIAQANVMNDKGMQRTAALADARVKLAAKFKVRVQNMFTQLDQQVTTAAGGDPARKPIRSEVMNRVMDNVTRQLVDQVLAGTTPREWYQDPNDHNLYCFLVMTRESMDRALASEAQAQIKHEINQGEKSLDAALDKLDAAIAASK
jgi:hypothetical protein